MKDKVAKEAVKKDLEKWNKNLMGVCVMLNTCIDSLTLLNKEFQELYKAAEESE